MRRALWAASGLAAIALWRVSITLEPERGLGACLVRHVIGVPCPGCGMTRAMLFLARGDWRRAVVFHPLAPMVLAEVLVLWLVWGAIEFGGLGAPSRRTVNRLLFVNAALLVVVWLWRLGHGSLPG